MTAAICGAALDDLNSTKVARCVQDYIPKLATEQVVDDLSSDDANSKVWDAAVATWTQAGGCPLSGDVLRTLFGRSLGSND